MKYEYQVLKLGTGTFRRDKAMKEWIEKFNEHGQDGWELVAVIPMHSGIEGTTEIRAFFKKEKK